MIHDGDSLPAYWWFTVVRKPFLLPRNMDVYHAISPVEAMWLPEHKSVVTVHDMLPVIYPLFQGSGIGENKLRQWFSGEFYAHCLFKSAICAQVAADSTMTATQYVRFVDGLKDRVDVIYLGISRDLMPMHHPRARRMRFGYLGQLDRRKRVDVLIRAFKASKVDATLLIAGAGRDNDMLRQLAAGDDRIIFMGFLPDSKLSMFYNSLTALVLPSYMEGWGLPAVEAMACGTPVVILQDTVMPYEVRDKCYQTADLTAMFDSMASGLVLARDAHVDWAMSHTWERCVSEYEELYRRVAHE
jgi:glycosyltransferase involved in cell wall biosynthesis